MGVQGCDTLEGEVHVPHLHPYYSFVAGYFSSLPLLHENNMRQKKIMHTGYILLI